MNAKIVDLKQDTPQWLEYRFNHIGSSDAPIILGVSPFKTKYQLWLEKVNRQSYTKMNPAMKRGKELEPVVIEHLNKRHNAIFNPVVIEDIKKPWMSASLDAYSSELDIFYEIKLANKQDHEALNKEGRIPEKYIPQLNHQLYISNLPRCYYASYHDGDLIIKEHGFDKEAKRSHVKKMRDFYDLVLKRKEPELSNKDYHTLDSIDLVKISYEYLEVTKEIKRLELKQSRLKEEFIKEVAGQNIERAKVGDLKIRKEYRKKNVNYKKMATDLNLDLEKYRPDGFIECWVIK